VNTLYSGLVASVTSAVFAAVSGGFGTLATVGLVGWRLPKLYAYEIPRGRAAEQAPAGGEAKAEPDAPAAAGNGATPAGAEKAGEASLPPGAS
jgi:hypothetical protein